MQLPDGTHAALEMINSRRRIVFRCLLKLYEFHGGAHGEDGSQQQHRRRRAGFKVLLEIQEIQGSSWRQRVHRGPFLINIKVISQGIVSGEIYFSFAAAEVRRGILTQRKEDSNPRFPMAGEERYRRALQEGALREAARSWAEDTEIAVAPPLPR